MAERSFVKEIEKLRLGAGDTFKGEGILAVAKGLLESGVSYVGGYQGAPISHLMDVFNDARDLMAEYGVHFEQNASEAGAAAMLGASINYPLRGAVTWKSTVGTNVASDALSNLASAGVKGGALIVIGEDYGEGASIIQERSHAFATKSQMWLLDPRPSLPNIVRTVKHGFALSEASNTPVMLELRIRACHVYGQFTCEDNKAGEYNSNRPLPAAEFDYSRICLPPSTYAQEVHKVETRYPAALEYIREQKLNEVFPGAKQNLGIICQGGHYNSVLSALESLGLADLFGDSQIPIYCLNVTYPLLPEEVEDFCGDKDAVLIVEEGQPAYLQNDIKAILRDQDIHTKVSGKDVLPLAGEYRVEVVLKGIAKFLKKYVAEEFSSALEKYQDIAKHLEDAATYVTLNVPNRPPGFCTGCPERPIFSSMKMLEQENGPYHVAADIGCHTFGTLPPFNIGNTVLGYGMGLASAAALPRAFGDKPVVSIMGDGGFWHNGLSSGVSNAVFNNHNDVLILIDNGYTAATGGQDIPSSRNLRLQKNSHLDIAATLKGMGVKWIKKLDNYKLARVRKALAEALTSKQKGLKVIIAQGECMLNMQRRLKPKRAAALAAGKRVATDRFGVDESICTGDHACTRLSGCPSLTIKASQDPIKTDPVAHVDNQCVGCGLCGEVAHAAALCPSFYRARVISNPSKWELVLDKLRASLIPDLAVFSANKN